MGAVLEKMFVDTSFFGAEYDATTGKFTEPEEEWPQLFFTMFQLLFQGACYAYVLMSASEMIGNGTELLLLTPARGLVGSVVLPILGAVPDGAIILFSGGGQEDLAVGVGALAGSTIMLLTVPWSLALVGGRVDVKASGEPDYSKKPRLSEGTSLFNSACAVEPSIRKAGLVMALTSISYFVIQGPSFMYKCGFPDCECDHWKDSCIETKHCAGPQDKDCHKEAIKSCTQEGTDFANCLVRRAEAEKPYAMYGLIACGVFFVGYVVWQYVLTAGGSNDKQDQNKRYQVLLKVLKDKNRPVGALRSALLSASGKNPGVSGQDYGTMGGRDAEGLYKLYRDQINDEFKDMITRLFNAYNTNKLTASKTSSEENIDGSEIVKMQTELHFPENLKQQLKDEATGHAGGQANGLTLNEMLGLIWHWAHDDTIAPAVDGSAGEAEECDEDAEEEMPEDLEGLSHEEQQRAIWKRALFGMLVGTFFVLLFSDPLVGILGALGKQLGCPAFYISFVLAPLASNGTELLCAYNYSLKKTRQMQTTALSSLIGAACMNNTFCLGIFLFQIYSNGFIWEFSAETCSIILIEILMLFFALQEVQKAWYSIIVASLFPLSVAVVWLLENVVGLN